MGEVRGEGGLYPPGPSSPKPHDVTPKSVNSCKLSFPRGQDGRWVVHGRMGEGLSHGAKGRAGWSLMERYLHMNRSSTAGHEHCDKGVDGWLSGLRG